LFFYFLNGFIYFNIQNKGEIILEKLSIVEINPILDSETKTASAAVALMSSLFYEKPL
jgi:hypothetical protein